MYKFGPFGSGFGSPFLSPFGVRGLPFSPATEPLIFAWYDPSDATTITEAAGAVSQLDDKTTSGFDLTAPGGAEPITGTQTIGGLNALSCAGAEYLLNAAVAMPASGDFTVFMVASIGAVGSITDALISTDGTTGAGDNDFQVVSAHATQFDGEVQFEGMGASDLGLTGGPFTGPSVFEFVFDFATGSLITCFVDGVSVDTGEAYIGKIHAEVALNIFADRAAATPLTGLFGEIILTEAVDAVTRSKYRSYLTTKWLTSTTPTDAIISELGSFLLTETDAYIIQE